MGFESFAPLLDDLLKHLLAGGGSSSLQARPETVPNSVDLLLSQSSPLFA